MSRKKTAGKVPGMTKILATAVVMTMVMMMSKNAVNGKIKYTD